MSTYVIWVDRDHAKLFHFSDEKMERKDLQMRHTDHHTHHMDQVDHQAHERKFHDKIAVALGEVGQILILGPGIAKYHFQTYLREHRPMLARQIVGCETTDHPTDGQIADYARKFFK